MVLLPTFPPELLQIIVDEVASFHGQDTLRSCNATSRSLSHLARQHLFKRIVFHENDYDYDLDWMFSDIMTFYDHLSPPKANHSGISRYVKEVSFTLFVPPARRWGRKFFYLIDDPRFAKTLDLLSRQCHLTTFGFCFHHGYVQWSHLTRGFRRAFTSIINSPRIRDLEIRGLLSVPINLFDQSHATNLSLVWVTPHSTTHHKTAGSRFRLLSLKTNLSFNLVQVYANPAERPTHPSAISQLKTLIANIDRPNIGQLCNLLKANNGSLEILELNSGHGMDFKEIGAIDFEHLCNLKTLRVSAPIPPLFIPHESRSSFQVDQVLCLLQGSSNDVPLQHLKAKIGSGIPIRIHNFAEDVFATGSELGALDAVLSSARFAKLREVEISFCGTPEPGSLNPYIPTWLPRMFPRLSQSTTVAIKLTSV